MPAHSRSPSFCAADLAKPIDAVFDALHQSLEDHVDDSEEYHNLLLTLGSVGRHLPSGHPQQERTRETLERRLDEVVAENQVTERQWAQDMDAARTVIDAMPEPEWHTWCVGVTARSRSWSRRMPPPPPRSRVDVR